MVSGVLVSAASAYYIYKLYTNRPTHNIYTPEKVHLVENEKEWQETLKYLQKDLSQGLPVLGFNCRWVFNKHQNQNQVETIIHLSTLSSHSIILRLNKLSIIPKSLELLLADKQIIKVGVECLEDASKLLLDYNLFVNGCLDIRLLIGNVIECTPSSVTLKSLARKFLDFEVDESWRMRCDLSENDIFSDVHIESLAKYSLAGVCVLYEIFNISIWSTCRLLPSFLLQYKFRTFIKDAVDIHLDSSKNDCEMDHVNVCKNNDPFVGVKTVDIPKRPKGKICVCCAHGNFLLKKNIVPHEYRKHFPDFRKNHNCHDVVNLCLRCHSKSETYTEELKDKLKQRCHKAEINAEKNSVKLKQIKSAGRALRSCKDTLPKVRRKELELILKKHYSVDKVTDEIIKIASDINEDSRNKQISQHGIEVVKWYSQNGGLIELEKLCRRSFVSAMQPKYLPPRWSINYNREDLQKISS